MEMSLVVEAAGRGSARAHNSARPGRQLKRLNGELVERRFDPGQLCRGEIPQPVGPPGTGQYPGDPGHLRGGSTAELVPNDDPEDRHVAPVVWGAVRIDRD